MINTSKIQEDENKNYWVDKYQDYWCCTRHKRTLKDQELILYAGNTLIMDIFAIVLDLLLEGFYMRQNLMWGLQKRVCCAIMTGARVVIMMKEVLQ